VEVVENTTAAEVLPPPLGEGFGDGVGKLESKEEAELRISLDGTCCGHEKRVNSASRDAERDAAPPR
jgi:hypothetical protein